MRLMLAASLLVSLACATAKPAASQSAQACGSMTETTAWTETPVLAGPDGNSPVIATVKANTPLCVATEATGFGFRQVRLADGRDGYVRESALE